MRVLALTPDTALLRRLLASEISDGLELATESTIAGGLQRLKEPVWSLVLVDSALPEQDQIVKVIERIAATGQRVVLLARSISVELTLGALQHDVWDILPFPIDPNELRDVLARTRVTHDLIGERGRAGRRYADNAQASVEPLVGESAAVTAVLQTATRVADSTTTVLIQGERGTGKSLLARLLHEESRRRDQPFVTIDCGVIPDQFLESELFGFEKGAFAGAVARRAGSIERANGGTLFLDNVSDMSLPLQAKILRALQDRAVERLGGMRPVPIDVRVIAASRRPLGDEVALGQFREDFYEWLSVVVLELPPLRERSEDVRLIAEYCLKRGARDRRWQIESVADETLAILRSYPWPGNVRELCNVLERALFMADGPVLLPEHLPPDIRNYLGDVAVRHPERRSGAERRSSRDRRSGPTPLPPLEALERDHIRRVLGFTGGHLGHAADLLGIHRNTLRRKLRDFGLRPNAEPDRRTVERGGGGGSDAVDLRSERPPS